MRELYERIKIMSKMFKPLNKILKWIPRANNADELYELEREQKVYPSRFTSKEERRAHTRKVNLYLSLSLYS